MLPSAITGAGGAAILRPGDTPAARAALLAILATTAATVSLTRERIAWEAYLDMPVGLTLPQEPGAGSTPIAGKLHFGEPRPGTGLADPQEGWLVALGITNAGHVPVRDTDFSAQLAFTFPGREIHATQISPRPTTPVASTTRQPPAARVSAPNGPAGNHAARLELSGDFLLRPGDSYSLTLILSGTPQPVPAP
jgi:hypothetical protein